MSRSSIQTMSPGNTIKQQHNNNKQKWGEVWESRRRKRSLKQEKKNKSITHIRHQATHATEIDENGAMILLCRICKRRTRSCEWTGWMQQRLNWHLTGSKISHFFSRKTLLSWQNMTTDRNHEKRTIRKRNRKDKEIQNTNVKRNKITKPNEYE